MRALHFGAGNIGRGFIGKLLAENGYRVVFADVVPGLISELQRRKEYSVHVVGGDTEHEDLVKIEGAVFSNTDAVLDQVMSADLITTAVGPRILERIAPTLAKGLTERQKIGIQAPVNIIACENAIRATTILREFVYKYLDSNVAEWVKKNVGFVDCAVDRIVPPANFEDPLGVTVEEFCEWVVDRSEFVGRIPDIKGMTVTDNLNSFVERKLMTVNTGHAICAYLGKLYGHKEIRSAILDPRVRQIVEGAMRESGSVLIKKYGMDPLEHEKYIQKILERYENPYIIDDVNRVGREPIRKLSPEDRLIKPLKGAIEYGLPYDNLVQGIAAALLYNDPDDVQAVKLQKTIQALGSDGALSTISNLSPTIRQAVSGKVKSALQNLEGDNAIV